MNEPTPPPQGHILYDASCGFCRRWIPFWASTLNRRGFQIAPLRSPWVRRRLNLPNGRLLDNLRLLLPDGAQVEGAEVYRHVMRRIWWTYPLYLLSLAPILRQLFDRSYRAFATYRFRISSALGLGTCSISNKFT